MNRFCKRCGEIFPATKYAKYCEKCKRDPNEKWRSGFKKCPAWLHKKYREAVKFICMECKKHEDEVGKLEPHRVKRGHKGGKYTLVPINHPESNVKVVCHKCHRIYHQGEFK
jgi:hypothetical protein